MYPALPLATCSYFTSYKQLQVLLQLNVQFLLCAFSGCHPFIFHCAILHQWLIQKIFQMGGCQHYTMLRHGGSRAGYSNNYGTPSPTVPHLHQPPSIMSTVIFVCIVFCCYSCFHIILRSHHDCIYHQRKPSCSATIDLYCCFWPRTIIKTTPQCTYVIKVLYRIFRQRGEIIVCGNVFKLGGLGAWSPRKILKFTTSETASGGF